MIAFRDTNKSLKLDGGLLKTMTIYKLNVDHSNPHDRKKMYEFGKEMKLNIKHKRRKGPRDEPVTRLLESPAIMALGISTIFLSENPNEFCDRLMETITRKTSNNNSHIIDGKSLLQLINY